VAGIGQERRDRFETGRIRDGARQIGDQVAGLADMTQADRLAEIGEAMQRSVQRRDLVTDRLKLSMRIEDEGIGGLGQRVGKGRAARAARAGAEGPVDLRGD